MQKSNIITQKEFDQLMATGKYQAIVKEIGNARYLIGLERSKSSSKYHEKLMLPRPLNLTAIVTSHKLKLHMGDLWDPTTPKPSWIRHPILRARIEKRIREFVAPKPGDEDPAKETVPAPKGETL